MKKKINLKYFRRENLNMQTETQLLPQNSRACVKMAYLLLHFRANCEKKIEARRIFSFFFPLPNKTAA